MEEISTEALRALLVDSRRVLTRVCERVADDHRVSLEVRTLISSRELLPTFLDLAQRNPDVAELVLQASVASLVNAQSIMVVDAELNRRAECN